MTASPRLTALKDILARVEAASGPDYEIDATIWLATTLGATRKLTTVTSSKGLWRPYDIDETRDTTGRLITVPRYTQSLDACIALAERGLPDCYWLLAKRHCREEEPLFGAKILHAYEGISDAESNASLALAFLAAILTALIAIEEKGNGV